jgi:hypothetical protein
LLAIALDDGMSKAVQRVKQLFRVIGSDDAGARRSAFSEVEAMDFSPSATRELVTQLLRQQLRDPNPFVRAYSAGILLSLDSDDRSRGNCFEIIIEAATIPEPELQEWAVVRILDFGRESLATSFPNEGGIAPIADVLSIVGVNAAASVTSDYEYDVKIGAELISKAWNAREEGRVATSCENLSRIAHAMRVGSRNVHGSTGKQVCDVYSDEGMPLLSWRVRLLPYLGEALLYREFDMREPWDSAGNVGLIRRMPGVFANPCDDSFRDGRTSYLRLIRDERRVANSDDTMDERDDSRSSCIVLVEASSDRSVPWSEPKDFLCDPVRPRTGLVGRRRGYFLVGCDSGEVRRIESTISDVELATVLFPS